MLVFILFTCAVGLAIALWFYKQSNYIWPPGPAFSYEDWTSEGPYEYPLPHVAFMEDIAEKYGKVVTMWYNYKRAVFVSDFDVAYEALAKRPTDFAGRPNIPTARYITHGLNISHADYSQDWRKLKGVVFSALKNSVTDCRIEEIVQISFKKLVYFLDYDKDLKNNLSDYTYFAVVNNVSNMLFGKTYDLEGKPFRNLMKHFASSSDDLFTNCYLEDVIPFLYYMPSGPFRIAVREKELFLEEIFKPEVENRKRNPAVQPKDFLDFLLSKNPEIIDLQLQELLHDLFEAGLETSVTTFQWMLFFMAYYPMIQDKVYAEIRRVCKSTYPTLAQRDQLPYTEATLMEIQRRGTLAVTSMTHTATIDGARLGQYILPQGTPVYFNFYSFHHDDKLFPEPLEFKPDRFLHQENDASPVAVRKNVRGFMPFGEGARMCAGRAFAKSSLILLFAMTVQRYKIEWPKGEKKPSPDSFYEEYAFTGKPVDFHVKLSKR